MHPRHLHGSLNLFWVVEDKINEIQGCACALHVVFKNIKLYLFWERTLDNHHRRLNADDEDIELGDNVNYHGSLFICQFSSQLDRLNLYQDVGDLCGEVIGGKKCVEIKNKSKRFRCCHFHCSSCRCCQRIFQDCLTKHHCRCCAFFVLCENLQLFIISQGALNHADGCLNVDDEDGQLGNDGVHLHQLSISQCHREHGRLDLQHQGRDLANVEEVGGDEGVDLGDNGKEAHGSHLHCAGSGGGDSVSSNSFTEC